MRPLWWAPRTINTRHRRRRCVAAQTVRHQLVNIKCNVRTTALGHRRATRVSSDHGYSVVAGEQPAETPEDARERLADSRDSTADRRDRAADLREQAADERDARADERDSIAERRDLISEKQSVVHERHDHSFESATTSNARTHPADRSDSARLRDLSARDRAMAANDRQMDLAEQPENSSASPAAVSRGLAADRRDVAAGIRDDIRDDRDHQSSQRDDEFADVVEVNFERRPVEREHAAEDREEAAQNREYSSGDRAQSAHDRATAAGARDQLRRDHNQTIVALSARQSAALQDSQRDALTGLPNRHQMNGRLASGFAGRSAASATPTLMFIDIDDFKLINDQFGHVVGDDMLRAVGAKLTETTPVGDLVARIGGDEFVIISDNERPAADLLDLAEVLRVAVAEPLGLSGEAPVTVTVSIGIASAMDCLTELDLLRRADIALHEAKGAGRNQCALFGNRPNSLQPPER